MGVHASKKHARGILETFRVILSIPVRMFAGEKKQLVDV